MKLIVSTPIRCSLVLLIIALIVSGCSSSTDSSLGESEADANPSGTNGDGVVSDEGADSVANEMENTTTGDTTSGAEADSSDGIDESITGSGMETASDAEGLSTTRVDFDITVPVYSSNALQVRLIWGDIDTTAMWNSDELWTVSVDFPAGTENQLVVTFSDDNGDIELGSFEQAYKTGFNPTESYQISAGQFDTERWDADGDGTSNLQELTNGANPIDAGNQENSIEPVRANLELLRDKTFRINWQPSENAQFYRVLENPDGVSGFTQISTDLESSLSTYNHRVALYKRFNARYVVLACNSASCVESNEIEVSGTLERVVGIFKASNTDSFDNFGASVALSADGSTLAVSSPGESSSSVGINGNQQNNANDESGAVYVFERRDGTWYQQAYIKTSNSESGDTSRSLGGVSLSVTLSANGNILAVGAPGEDSAATGVNGNQQDNSVLGSGAVYIFERSDSSWDQQAYLKASNTGPNDAFHYVVLSADGNTLAVGAPGEDSGAIGINGDQQNNSVFGAGAVYVFVRNGGSWLQQAYVKASALRTDSLGDSRDIFGTSISLSDDGDILAAGRLGGVHVYVRSAGNWNQRDFVDASVIGADGSFGRAVALSSDGTTLAVSAEGDSSSAAGVNSDPSDSSPGLQSSGAVYVFGRGDGVWTQQAYIKASNPDSLDRFGRDLSLNSNGNYLAVLAIGEKSNAVGINGSQNDNSIAFGSGAVYVFARTNGVWQQQAYVKAPHGSRIGQSIEIAASANALAIGSTEDRSVETGINGEHEEFSLGGAGAVFLY